MLNINNMKQFEYALAVFSENRETKYKIIFEYNGKLATAKFLTPFITFPVSIKYDEKFMRVETRTQWEDEHFDLIALRHIIFEKMQSMGSFSNRLFIPDSIDLIDTVYSFIDRLPDDLTPVDSLKTVTNLHLLESDIHFDSYRFPDDALFNVVSVEEMDN